jgi:hypothetical protein
MNPAFNNHAVMNHAFDVRVGPVGFRIGSAWAAPLTQMRHLYVGYPRARIAYI